MSLSHCNITINKHPMTFHRQEKGNNRRRTGRSGDSNSKICAPLHTGHEGRSVTSTFPPGATGDNGSCYAAQSDRDRIPESPGTRSPHVGLSRGYLPFSSILFHPFNLHLIHLSLPVVLSLIFISTKCFPIVSDLLNYAFSHSSLL